jgi:hypothetical protein
MATKKFEKKEDFISQAGVGEKFWIPVEWVDVEDDVQLKSRGIQKETVREYTQTIMNAVSDNEKPPFPPVDVYLDKENKKILLSDGHQRYYATKAAMYEEIYVSVFEGDTVDAKIRVALGNRHHGLPLNTKQKKEAGERLIELTNYSDNIIAKELSVSARSVSNWRKDMIEAGKVVETGIRTAMRDGQAYTISTGDTKTKKQLEAEAERKNLQEKLDKATEFAKSAAESISKCETADEANKIALQAQEYEKFSQEKGAQSLVAQMRGIIRQAIARKELLKQKATDAAKTANKMMSRASELFQNIQMIMAASRKEVASMTLSAEKAEIQEQLKDAIGKMTEAIELLADQEEIATQLLDSLKDDNAEKVVAELNKIRDAMSQSAGEIAELSSSIVHKIDDTQRKKEELNKQISDDTAIGKITEEEATQKLVEVEEQKTQMLAELASEAAIKATGKTAAVEKIMETAGASIPAPKSAEESTKIRQEREKILSDEKARIVAEQQAAQDAAKIYSKWAKKQDEQVKAKAKAAISELQIHHFNNIVKTATPEGRKCILSSIAGMPNQDHHIFNLLTEIRKKSEAEPTEVALLMAYSSLHNIGETKRLGETLLKWREAQETLGIAKKSDIADACLVYLEEELELCGMLQKYTVTDKAKSTLKYLEKVVIEMEHTEEKEKYIQKTEEVYDKLLNASFFGNSSFKEVSKPNFKLDK